MKLRRLALCVAVFALVGGIAFSEDMDIRALQAKLAAQEARLNDLQAKMGAKSGGGAADNVVSLRKVGKVVIGGDFNARMYQFTGKVKHKEETTNKWTTTTKLRATDHRLNDAKLRVLVDVNDYFEAFFRFDMQAGGWEKTEDAYVRWKNVCNSGFSLLVGRTAVVYGGGGQHGATWSGFYGGFGQSSIDNLVGRDAFQARHVGFDFSRTNQVTASWENPEGTFKAELSYFQAVNKDTGGRWDRSDNEIRSINDGFGSGSARLTWKPIEGLNLVGSAINLYNNVDHEEKGGAPWSVGQGWNNDPNNAPRKGIPSVANHTAVDFMAAWNPAFAPNFKIWGMYAHDWNAGWVDDVDVDKFQLGLSYRFPKVNVYAFGEYMHTDYGDSYEGYVLDGVYYGRHKTNAYALQTGFKYFIGYGVDFEMGYRFEDFKNKLDGAKNAKAYLHSVHARLNFNF